MPPRLPREYRALPEISIEPSCYVRDHAEKVLGISTPEAVAGVTAHPALDKACHYLKVKLVKVPVDAVTQR